MVVGAGALVSMSGCASPPANEPSASSTQPATAINLATTQPSYWLDQPPAATISGSDFDKLWHTCEQVARDFLFKIDRTDYRAGVLTTEPLVSGQWFEPWRRDARTVYDREESSLATIRRTIRFEFTRQDDGTWRVAPKVLVERQALAERRITSAVQYRSVYAQPARARLRATGTHESDEGVLLPDRYWYPLRRDTTFEQALARAVEKKLSK